MELEITHNSKVILIALGMIGMTMGAIALICLVSKLWNIVGSWLREYLRK